MESQDLKYRLVLNKLKNTEPVLDDPDGLADRIMQRVEQTSVRAGRIRTMRISGIMSGVAASALVCLLACETLRYSAATAENDPGTEWTAVEKIYPRKVTELSIGEKGKIVENAVKSRETQLARKKQLYASFLVRSKIANSY
ncbi:MAG: hypothetical protein LBL04_04960 [Bacteroidales bacterium]|jgi:hypothetical protein|nr:hypothetical protein [Bacteroidales bacterium]